MPSICINILAFATSLLGLLRFRSHLMSALLCLEGMMPSLFLLSSLLVLSNHLILTAMLLIILLVFAACEAAVGLPLLVMVSNAYRLDYV